MLMLQRTFVLTLTIISLLAFLGCGGDSNNKNPDNKPTVQTQTQKADVPSSSNKTYLNAGESDKLTLDMLKATLAQLDNQEKDSKITDKRLIAKNNAIRAVIQKNINSFETPIPKHRIDAEIKMAMRKIYNLLISDIKTMDYYNTDGKGRLVVRVAFRVENVSNEAMDIYTNLFYLFKEGHNSVKADSRISGFYQNTIEEIDKNRFSMKLMPGDFAYAVLLFKTNMTDKTAEGATIRYQEPEYILFKLDKNMNAGGINEAVNSKTNSTELPSETAAYAFRLHHDHISHRNFTAAYINLSDSMKKYVGGYDNFVKGYETTIYSKIVELKELPSSDKNVAKLEYILEAKDRTQSGTIVQRFKGVVTLVHDRFWKITDNRAKKI